MALVLSALITVSAFAKEPPKNKISMEKARAKAVAAYAGEIKSEELEFEHGKWIYSFDIARPGQSGVQEVQIDAIKGSVVSSVSETAQQEANEAD